VLIFFSPVSWLVGWLVEIEPLLHYIGEGLSMPNDAMPYPIRKANTSRTFTQTQAKGKNNRREKRIFGAYYLARII